MAITRAVRRGAGAALAVALLVGCGGDDGAEGATTTTEVETTTTEAPEPESTTTEAVTTTTTEAPAAAAACDAVGAAEVTAVLGAGAAAGEPVVVEGDGEGCVWRSASGAAAMGAVLLPASALPADLDAATAFPLFGLGSDGYPSTTVSRSTSGDLTALVVVGFEAPPDPAASDAVSAVGAALLDA